MAAAAKTRVNRNGCLAEGLQRCNEFRVAVLPFTPARFMRMRRPSEETSDSDEKLFIPVQASSPPMKKATSAAVSGSRGDDRDSVFVTIPLTPEYEWLPLSVRATSNISLNLAEHTSPSEATLATKGGNSTFVLQRTMSAPPLLNDTSPLTPGGGHQGASADGDHFNQRSRSTSIVDSLLFEIYDKLNFGRRLSGESDTYTECSRTRHSSSGSWVTDSLQKLQSGDGGAQRFKRFVLENKSISELQLIAQQIQNSATQVTNELVRLLKRRDRLLTKRDRSYDIVTAILQATSLKRRIDARMRFSVEPFPGDSGFAQWHDAMRMVARLPGGIPWEFRKRLWLTMAEKHVQQRKVDWNRVKRFCFNDRSNPDDNELGVQIVKDLHRTGCSLFCGEDAEHNQALLKRVLLAYARWNKMVGYCQGFNMLAALILEVMEWKEEDALKVMIYLIERVLPESYFANNLSGLSVDMAVFRDLLRMRLPGLSRHLDHLQLEARDTASGTSYEPPLTNVFTMQWFLTLFSNCLPKVTVLRVWDLIFLEGNEVLLRTALTIWDGLADRIMAVNSADEFYSIMGVLTREMLEFGLMDANHLVKTICAMAPFPFPQLPELRDKYRYNITPFTAAAAAMGVAKRGLRLFYSDDEDDNEEEALAVAAWCFSSVFPPQLSPSKNREVLGQRTPSPSSSGTNFSSIGPGAFGSSTINFLDPVRQPADADRMSLDISALKKQYAKLRERQKQAHIILTAANTNQQSSGTPRPTSVAMNHLLLGKKPLITKKGKGPAGNHLSASAHLKFQFRPTQGSAPNKVAKNSSRKDAGVSKVPGTWSEMNIRGAKQTGNSVGHTKDRKSSLPTPDSGQTLHWKDARKPREVRSSPQTGSMKDHITKDDDASSTSTELCDEDTGKLSDLGSDLEGEERDSNVSTVTVRYEGEPNVLAQRATLDHLMKSVDESLDGDTISVLTATTPTTTIATIDSIPSVVLSPGEWSQNDWTSWSRTSMDKEGDDDNFKNEEAAEIWNQSSVRCSLRDWLDSCQKTTEITNDHHNAEVAETDTGEPESDTSSTYWKFSTVTSGANAAAEDLTKNNVNNDDDDDYSEERRQEWLAKLEMYRRTLGVDSFEYKTSTGDDSADSNRNETTGDVSEPRWSTDRHDNLDPHTNYPSSDEFHSLSSEQAQWEDDDVNVKRKTYNGPPSDLPTTTYTTTTTITTQTTNTNTTTSEDGSERKDYDQTGTDAGTSDDAEEQWHGCLSDTDWQSSEADHPRRAPLPLQASKRSETVAEHRTNPKLGLENCISTGSTLSDLKTSTSVCLSSISTRNSQKGDVCKRTDAIGSSVGDHEWTLNDGQLSPTSTEYGTPYYTKPRGSSRIFPDGGRGSGVGDVGSPDRGYTRNEKGTNDSDNDNELSVGNNRVGSPKPSYFNPFPVARKSQIWGSSEVGIKLGLYDASRASSGQKVVGKKPGQR